MTNPLQKISDQATHGAQRLPTVAVFENADAVREMPPQTVYVSQEEGDVRFQYGVAEAASLSKNAGPQDINGNWIIDETLPGNRVRNFALAPQNFVNATIPGRDTPLISGQKFAPVQNVIAKIHLFSEGGDSGDVTLTLNHPNPASFANLLMIKYDDHQRFRVGLDSVHVGFDLPDSTFSVFNELPGFRLIAGRSSNDFVYLENSYEVEKFSVKKFGHTYVGGTFTAEGVFYSTGADIEGELYVNSQANILKGTQLDGDLHVAGPMFFGAPVTLDGGYADFPSSYTFQVGDGAWVRASGDSPDRVIIEGVSSSLIGELQLGTGGPVLRGAGTSPGFVNVGSGRILTEVPGGIIGSQVAFDTVTGAATSDIGNIAEQTVQTFNLKDNSISRANLSAGAVGLLQIADGSFTDSQIVALAVSKLLSGVLDADEVYMGPEGTIYAGPTQHSEITNQRVQVNQAGLKFYNSGNVALNEFTPGSFSLRSAESGNRVTLTADTGLSIYEGSTLRARLGAGEFTLIGKDSGARTVFDSPNGVQFIAVATQNLATNPGFKTASGLTGATNCEAVNDQQHVFSGEFSVRTRSTTTVAATASYVDVPIGATVGTGVGADSATNLISIFVWSDVACWTQIEGRDSVSNLTRGTSVVTQIPAGRWTRVFVTCSGRIDRVRLHQPTSDAARTTRIPSYLWYSALQVERDRVLPTPFCAGTEPGCLWDGTPYASSSTRAAETVTASLSPQTGIMVSGALVGGTITSANMLTTLLVGTTIKGNRIKGNTFQANIISGDQIVANTIDGSAFQANTTISNISMETGVSGRKVLISGPNNSIRFFPVASTTRFTELYSSVPSGLPNDIGVELRAINSALISSGTVVSRVRVQPQHAFIGLTDSTNPQSTKGGLMYGYGPTTVGGVSGCFFGWQLNASAVAPSQSGIEFENTGEIQVRGWWRRGEANQEQATMQRFNYFTPGFDYVTYGYEDGAYTWSTDVVGIAGGYALYDYYTDIYDAFVWLGQITRTSYTVYTWNFDQAGEQPSRLFMAWFWRLPPS